MPAGSGRTNVNESVVRILAQQWTSIDAHHNFEFPTRRANIFTSAGRVDRHDLLRTRQARGDTSFDGWKDFGQCNLSARDMVISAPTWLSDAGAITRRRNLFATATRWSYGAGRCASCALRHLIKAGREGKSFSMPTACAYQHRQLHASMTCLNQIVQRA